MAELKYIHAYDENGKTVSINDYTKETSKQHTFRCIGCGHTLLPRAFGSEYRRAHFYHKEEVQCSGETYLHNLAKHRFKELFDKSERYDIYYEEDSVCNNTQCGFREAEVCKKHIIHDEPVNLKEFYDICEIEAKEGDFIADVILKSSKNPQRTPIFVEIWNTHKSTENKIRNNKVIEITIKSEEDVETYLSRPVLRACEKVHFYSFLGKTRQLDSKEMFCFNLYENGEFELKERIVPTTKRIQGIINIR